MDYMDTDQVLEVPDTPDKLAVQNVNGRGCIERERNSSVTGSGCSENCDFSDQGIRNQPMGKSKLIIGGSRRQSFCPQEKLSISDKSKFHSNLTVSASGSSSSTRNGPLFRRARTDKSATHGSKLSIYSQLTEKRKNVCTSQTSNCKDSGAVVDLTEQNGHTRTCEKAFPCGSIGIFQADEFRKGSSVNGFSCSHSLGNSLISNYAGKGKDKVDDTFKVGSSFDSDKKIGFFGGSQHKAGKAVPSCLHSIASLKVTGQKRLVRNGCISPHNIEKAKQLAEKNKKGPADVVQNDNGAVESNASPSLVDVRDLIGADNDSFRAKGKGVVNQPILSGEPDASSTHFPSRSSSILNKKANRTDDAFRCLETLSGWRSTRNRMKLCFVKQQHENRSVRGDRGNGGSARPHNDYTGDQEVVSCQHGAAPSVVQTVTHYRSKLNQFNEHQRPGSTLIKRQKQGSTSGSHAECSTSAADDSELVFLGSSGEPSNSRSTRNQHQHSAGILDPVIEIDEFSPEIRQNASHNIGHSSNDESDARARQVEADEMLARDLQEQLYNEAPGVGVGEIDAHIAFALQQEEDSPYAFSDGSQHVFRPRGSLISNSYRQLPSQSSQNHSIRRGTQARIPPSTRMARLRSDFPSQSPSISSRERNFLFPPNMDVDMRIHILEALEVFSDMGMAGNFLQVHRDFNENDYEMLLALDENNHQHGGASLDQINALPESIVQSDNFEEDCAVCLETPATGDTIRHLPCLHKFHKDCIDPWLRRRRSCPVCKSSIS